MFRLYITVCLQIKFGNAILCRRSPDDLAKMDHYVNLFPTLAARALIIRDYMCDAKVYKITFAALAFA